MGYLHACIMNACIMNACMGADLYVTVYGKTRHMGFFVKIKFDVYLISSSLELTYLQV